MSKSIHELLSLKGKVALVTGSRTGIGRAILFGLAEAGADVIQHAMAPRESMEADGESIKAMGQRHMAISADLQEADCDRKIFNAIGDFGSPDILILNASQQIRKPFEEITDADFDAQMHINFRSSMKLVQRFLPAMKQKGWGRIVTIGSIQQCVPHPDMMVYAASKEAQMNMVTYLAGMYAPYGITVNNVAPGTVLTGRNEAVLKDEAYRGKIEQEIPAGFIGEPSDCVMPVVMLCGEGGRFLTGENIYVDGGKHL